MDSKEKRQLETQLTKMGLAGLAADGSPSSELVQQLASLVNAWTGAPNRHGEWIDRHKYMRDLLNECDPAARTAMYWTIVPYLKFRAKSLADYEAMIAEKAGAMVSQRRMRVEGDAPKPIQVGTQTYLAAPAARATGAVATLTCHRCNKTQRFVAPTPVGAMIEGRKAGWVRDRAINKETCSDCAADLAAEEVVVLSRNQHLVVKDQRRVN